VELWGPMAATLTPVTVSVEYSSNNSAQFTAPSKIFSDTSMGMVGAHVFTRPPKESYANFWLGNTGISVMTLTYPAGAIIDLVFDMVLADGQALNTTNVVVVGATVGDVFVNSLDSTTDNLTPVSYKVK
jgi:hypothetical protein